jgi:hypothetical protein
MNREEILSYMQERASGVGQANNYSYKEFYHEMVELFRKEKLKPIEEKPIYQPNQIVEIIANEHGHKFEIGSKVTLKEYDIDSEDWFAEEFNPLGDNPLEYWYVKESEIKTI